MEKLVSRLLRESDLFLFHQQNQETSITGPFL